MALCAAAGALPALAAETSVPTPQALLGPALASAAAALPGRVEVEILAERLPPALAGCRRVEPFLPEHGRLWGRASIGARCVEGGSGSAFVPVRVKVFAPVLAAVRALPAGHVLGEQDMHLLELDVAAQPGTAIARPAQALGAALARPLRAGEALRTEALRPRPAVAAGETVRVLYTGRGFAVSAEGRALGPAQEGQPVRVQTEGGKVLTGTARRGRVVEIRGSEESVRGP